MLGRERRTAVEARAKQVARMVMVIVHSLQTKSYDQFAERFSNPGSEPAQLERLNCQACFQMRLSPSCWYDAVADFARRTHPYPFVNLHGGGDDFGVAISAGPGYFHVELYVPPDQKLGRDAKGIVRALGLIPGWTNLTEVERDLDLLKP